jgi:hypothetical protein
VHNYPNGEYGIGRHNTRNPTTITDKAHIVWFGYYPFNENLLKRKLQIIDNYPMSDKEKGYGIHHLYNRDQLLNINEEKSRSGRSLRDVNIKLYEIIERTYKNKTYIVTGGCGFIGSHMVDKLISLGYKVIVFDNLLSGNIDNLNKEAIFENVDIRDVKSLRRVMDKYDKVDGIFHFAAIARTPWCIEDPLLCYETNVTGTINIMEISREKNIKRVVLSSSNVVYAFLTPYRTSKVALEGIGMCYN